MMGAPLSGNAQLFHPRHLHMTEKRAALPSPPPPHGDRGHIDAHMDIAHGAAGWDSRGGMGVARCAPPSLVTPPRPEPRGAFFAPLGRGAAHTSSTSCMLCCRICISRADAPVFRKINALCILIKTMFLSERQSAYSSPLLGIHTRLHTLQMAYKRAALPSPPPPHGDRGHIDAHMDIAHGAAGWDARGGMGVARCTPPSLVIPPRSAPPEGRLSHLGAEAQRRHTTVFFCNFRSIATISLLATIYLSIWGLA